MVLLLVLARLAVEPRARRHVGLDAEDRLDAVGMRGLVEAERAEHHPVVGDRDRRHRHALGLGEDRRRRPVRCGRLDPGRPVQQRVLGVNVQMNEAVSRRRGDLRRGVIRIPVFHNRPGRCGNLHDCDSSRPNATSPPRRRQASRSADAVEGRGEVLREVLLERDPPVASPDERTTGARRAGTGGPSPSRAGVVPPAPVRAVPEDRMPDRRQVDADLMRAPRPGHGLQERRARQALPDLEPGLRPPALRSRPRRSWTRAGRAARPPRRRRSRRRPGRARGRRARTAWSWNMLAQRRVRRVRLRHDEQSGGAGIEPVHDAGPERAAGRRERDAHPEQPVHERPAAPAGGGMRHEPRRLRHRRRDARPRTGSARAAPRGRAAHRLRSRSSVARPRGGGTTSDRGSPSTCTVPCGDRSLHVGARLAGHPWRRPRRADLPPRRACVSRPRRRRLGLLLLPPGRSRSPTHARRIAPTTIARVGEVEHRPHVEVDEVHHAAPHPRPRMARSVRLPSAPPRTSPSEAPTSRLVCRNEVARMITTTTAVTPTKNQGARWPMLNAPPELVVNRSVSTPGIDVDRARREGSPPPRPS